MKKHFKEQLRKAKVWATGENFEPITALFISSLVIGAIVVNSVDLLMTHFRIILTAPVILAIQAIARLMGLMERERVQHFFYVIGNVFFFVTLLTCFNTLPSLESTRLPKEFFTKGDFITFYH